MNRRPPSIVSVLPTAEGGIEVHWQVDSFYSESAEPERVLIDLNGFPFSELAGDEESVEIPRSKLESLGTAVVTISVSFWWSGSPPEEKQSSIPVPFQPGGGGGGHAGVYPAARPVVTLVGVQPRTLRSANSITIAWRSNNYNDGNIFWGPATTPRVFRRNIRPTGENYQGTFTTDQAVIPSTHYVFTVEVRNTLHSPGWISSTAAVRSAESFASLRRFLDASAAPLPAGLRALVGQGRSLRRLLQG